MPQFIIDTMIAVEMIKRYYLEHEKYIPHTERVL